jgi:hypothetical protein
MAALGLFVLFPLGLASFELWRYFTCRTQLQYSLDSAALCATANLLAQKSSQSTGPSQFGSGQLIVIEQEAIKSAEIMLERNDLLGSTFSRMSTVIGAVSPADAPTGRGKLYATFVDSKRMPLAPGAPGVKGVRLTASYGLKPFSAEIIGLKCLPMQVTSEGGIPPVDLVLCFDVSASMDDGTNVTTVKRFWNGSQVSYSTPAAGNGSLLSVVQPQTDGTKVNVVGPESLSMLSSPSNGGRLFFSESPSSTLKGLRALVSRSQSEVGQPPGNYNASNPRAVLINAVNPQSSVNGITDLVVNLDSNTSFGGWTDPSTGLQFPNVQTLVEAARGNLNSFGAMQQALVTGAGRPAWLPPTAPNPLYQQVYFARAQQVTQPMATAKTAAIELLRALDQASDLHAALVSFSDYIGTDANSVWGFGPGATTYFIDSNWAAGGTGTCPLPLIRLNAGQANTIGLLNNFFDRWLCPPAYAQAPPPPPTQTIVQLIATLVATGQSNIASALSEAISELTNPACTRPDAEKIILLISDGKPDQPGGELSAEQACYTQATAAKRNGIKIIALDVATTADLNHAAFLQQVARLSNGSYIGGATPAQLNLALEKILTQLVALR